MTFGEKVSLPFKWRFAGSVPLENKALAVPIASTQSFYAPLFVFFSLVSYSLSSPYIISQRRIRQPRNPPPRPVRWADGLLEKPEIAERPALVTSREALYPTRLP